MVKEETSRRVTGSSDGEMDVENKIKKIVDVEINVWKKQKEKEKGVSMKFWNTKKRKKNRDGV